MLYVALMMEAFPRWREWNRRWGEELYHETGLLCVSRQHMRPGTFEHDGYRLLSNLGFPLRRLGGSLAALHEARRNFPLMSHSHVDGYYNPIDGWAESGKVMEKLIEEARQKGVNVVTGIRCKSILTAPSAHDSSITNAIGIETVDGLKILADQVILSAGAWSVNILPELKQILQTSGQPVLIWKTKHPELFQGSVFPPFASDISTSGWYGFPLTKDGYFKVGNHGAGYQVTPDRLDYVPDIEMHKQYWRTFFQETFPKDVADGIEFVYSRLCYYCDSFDGDFLIDNHPKIANLVVATGDSGHGFKFAPVIGRIIADVAEKKPNEYSSRFAWRMPTAGPKAKEASRKANDKPYALPEDLPPAKL
eukprot:TRINITY_DN5900_c0_g1_i1.p1 TRINITY_DN5900_c0_g1~~TRINITY_DN5900_c0_g1_i1.p1  ORF type:complete len:364 (-),score=54.10 TRINITY_DN5900_c0_g1_i1:158-1249(-)